MGREKYIIVLTRGMKRKIFKPEIFNLLNYSIVVHEASLRATKYYSSLLPESSSTFTGGISASKTNLLNFGISAFLIE